MPSKPFRLSASQRTSPWAGHRISKISKLLQGVTEAVSTLQATVQNLNQRVDTLADQLASSKATTTKLAPSVMKMERIPLTAQELEHLRIRKEIADQAAANERKLVEGFTAGSGIEARRGIGFR